MTRRGWAWAAVALVVAFVLAALTWGTLHAVAPQQSVVGRPAPALALHTYGGRLLTLRQLRGRPVVLNFWASWCAPCHQEQPLLNSAAAQAGGRVAFVGVDIQDSPPAAKAYLAAEDVPYPAGTAAGASGAFGVNGPPETFFINTHGQVTAKFVGPLDEANLALYMTELSA